MMVVCCFEADELHLRFNEAFPVVIISGYCFLGNELLINLFINGLRETKSLTSAGLMRIAIAILIQACSTYMIYMTLFLRYLLEY